MLTAYASDKLVRNTLRSHGDYIYIGVYQTWFYLDRPREPWYDPGYRRLRTHIHDWHVNDGTATYKPNSPIDFHPSIKWPKVDGFTLSHGERDRMFLFSRQWDGVCVETKWSIQLTTLSFTLN